VYEKLIVPLDGSNKAESILSFVEELALKFNSEITILGVPREHAPSVPPSLDKYIDNVNTQFNNKGLHAKYLLLRGNPGEEIIKYANANNDGLLAMANYGGSGSSHWLLGDLTGKLLLRTVTPLLLAPEKSNEPGKEHSKFKKILIPLDNSTEGEAALPFAIELAKKTNARINLLHVIPSIEKTYGMMKYAVNFEKQLFETLKKEGEDYFQGIIEKLAGDKLDIKYHFIVGTPAESILSYAEESFTDLIAIATHGRTGIKRFVLGSVARQVVLSSDIPVLLVRSKKQ